MKTKIILALMIMLSMLMVSAAEEGTFEIEDSIENVDIDVTVDYDADTWECMCGGSKEYYDGEYEIDGTMEYDNEVYNAELDAYGCIVVNNEDIRYLDLDIDGKLYQNGEEQYLYKDDNNKYYGHLESGYMVDGYIYYWDCKYWDDYDLDYYFNFEEYSKYVTTRSKPWGSFTLSAPSLGLGYKGSVAGDHIPELFTYRDINTWKRVTIETYPTGHDGPVIVTPARTAGEPIQETGYWDSAKGQRVLKWKANSA